MLGFLLDAHISPRVATGVSVRRPSCLIQSLHTWRDGGYRTASDADVLSAAYDHGLTLE